MSVKLQLVILIIVCVLVVSGITSLHLYTEGWRDNTGLAHRVMVW